MSLAYEVTTSERGAALSILGAAGDHPRRRPRRTILHRAAIATNRPAEAADRLRDAAAFLGLRPV